ncbi:MAG: flagellar hook-basal body complex protein FliE [Candidatus Baltobacteraceae bacterium]
MTVVPLVPDVPVAPRITNAPNADFGAAFERALEQAGRAFGRAARAEAAFVHGTGGLQEMVVERAQADVVLQIASAAASRVVQSLGTILNMQI